MAVHVRTPGFSAKSDLCLIDAFVYALQHGSSRCVMEWNVPKGAPKPVSNGTLTLPIKTFQNGALISGDAQPIRIKNAQGGHFPRTMLNRHGGKNRIQGDTYLSGQGEILVLRQPFRLVDGE